MPPRRWFVTSRQSLSWRQRRLKPSTGKTPISPVYTPSKPLWNRVIRCNWRFNPCPNPCFHELGVCRGFGFTRAAEALRTMEVTGRYIPPPPVFFRKDIIPWWLLAHLSQGYDSKRLLGGPVEFRGNRCALSFCRSRCDCPTRTAALIGFALVLTHPSILQDGASRLRCFASVTRGKICVCPPALFAWVNRAHSGNKFIVSSDCEAYDARAIDQKEISFRKYWCNGIFMAAWYRVRRYFLILGIGPVLSASPPSARNCRRIPRGFRLPDFQLISSRIKDK